MTFLGMYTHKGKSAFISGIAQLIYTEFSFYYFRPVFKPYYKQNFYFV